MQVPGRASGQRTRSSGSVRSARSARSSPTALAIVNPSGRADAVRRWQPMENADTGLPGWTPRSERPLDEDGAASARRSTLTRE